MDKEPFYYKSAQWFIHYTYDNINSKKSQKSATKEIYNVHSSFSLSVDSVPITRSSYSNSSSKNASRNQSRSRTRIKNPS